MGNGDAKRNEAPQNPANGKDKVKPLLRGSVHQHSIFGALSAGVLLVASAPTVEAKISCTIYISSLVALFTASTIYHRPIWRPETRSLLKRVDHAAIFVLIAGTYTPIAYVGLGGALGNRLLVMVWTGAAAGILQNFMWPRAPKTIKTGIYIALGWIIIPHAAEVGDALGPVSATLIVLGGITYSIGGIMYAANWPDPFPKVFGYHEIFHALAVLASALHFAAIYLLMQRIS